MAEVTRQPSAAVSAALTEISASIRGDVRADQLSRALYATDASIYEIIPDAVVMPGTVQDVVATVKTCGRHRIPLTPRGAGTGLTGGAVNRGIQLDCSRYLDRNLNIDVDQRIAQVEPGVVLDELNAALRPHGLHFAPDVATSSRATIGGMIANNSCGAHSVIYGRTVDHLVKVDVVLSDGSRVSWGHEESNGNGLARKCEQVLSEVARDYTDEIANRYPKVLRRSGGYALDRLKVQDGRINPETVVCGSEGTLAIVVGATLKLTPLPKYRGLVVAHFRDLLESLSATPAILEHDPAAIELVDKLILDAAMQHPTMVQRGTPIEGEPEALLIVELFDEDESSLDRRLRQVSKMLQDRKLGFAWPIVIEPERQAEIWDIRKSGLGLLMSRPGDRQPYAFVEDTAVAPARLREYIERFGRILSEEDVQQAGYYAHASVGCLHVRPVLNLKNRPDVERMHRIADRVSSLALEFGGTMTGEHGDGIVRSCWLEKMYGPRIIEAFGKIKHAFDPDGILNPGKIVDPWPMTRNLRYDALPGSSPEQSGDTVLDFSAHGGMLGLATMCSGVGQCRQRLVGTMCPSYMATNDETHTTRARANALRIALSDHAMLDGLSDPALDDVMDLCLSCKACKSECPTGVDMAKLKAEWQWCRLREEGVPLRSRLIANIAAAARIAQVAPTFINTILQSTSARRIAERLFGFDRRAAPPRFAPKSFRRWFARREGTRRAGGSADGPPVALFVDTWTNHFTPSVGVALVRILESLGHRIIVPPVVCCGRPAISQGVLDTAAKLSTENANILAPHAERGTPIIAIEPSCFSALVDELPQLVRTKAAEQVARSVVTAESFIAEAIRQRRDVLRFRSEGPSVLYHAHCHQKALIGSEDALFALRTAVGGRVQEINSGCCGMAGAFGHEVEHYDVARAIGAQRLFPVVCERGDAEIAVSGFSCHHQIEQHTGARCRHVLEWIADQIAR